MANEQAKAFVDQATQSLQNSQFQQALDLVDQAIAIEPNASDSHVLRGICLSQLNQPDAATEAFRKAIMHSPYNSKAYYNLAVHFNALGNKKEAHELAREAVGVDPRNASARTFLTQLEAELSAPPGGATGTGADSSSMYDPLSAQPQAPAGRPGDQNVPPPARPTSAGAQDLPKPPSESDMPHVSAAPGQARPPAQAAPPASTNPYAQTGGSQFSPGGYSRPGYDQSAHSLPWIEGMGSAWTTIGWVLSALTLGLFIVGIIVFLSTFQTMFSSANSSNAMANFSAIRMSPVGIASWVVQILCVIWIVCDVIDRRAGWGWIVVLVIVGCCCGLPWIIIPIYILAGRK